MTNPTAANVAARAVILKAVTVHALAAPPRDALESMMKSWSWLERRRFRREAARMRDKYWRPLQDAGLFDHFSARERSFARSTAVTMTAQQQLDGLWRVEAFQVLLWALRQVAEIPQYDA
jgi:uncharacterized protein YjiS (DUF1127 family)